VQRELSHTSNLRRILLLNDITKKLSVRDLMIVSLRKYSKGIQLLQAYLIWRVILVEDDSPIAVCRLFPKVPAEA
jgi:hypothetical protein